MAPLGLAHVRGVPEKFQIEIHRLGRKNVILTATGREYGDFGDGIINTLVGDLEIYRGNQFVARAHGSAGLERRLLLSPH